MSQNGGAKLSTLGVMPLGRMSCIPAVIKGFKFAVDISSGYDAPVDRTNPAGVKTGVGKLWPLKKVKRLK